MSLTRFDQLSAANRDDAVLIPPTFSWTTNDLKSVASKQKGPRHTQPCHSFSWPLAGRSSASAVYTTLINHDCCSLLLASRS
jgi:hypothetical protein